MRSSQQVVSLHEQIRQYRRHEQPVAVFRHAAIAVVQFQMVGLAVANPPLPHLDVTGRKGREQPLQLSPAITL